MTDQETKIIERIKKVLAKAESTTSAAEAEMLMAKVQQMLTEHNITMLDVATLDLDDPVGTDKHFTKHRVVDSWLSHVAEQLARYYGCRTVRTGGYGGAKHTTAISVTGRLSNRVTFQLMLPFVKKQIMAEGRRLVHEQPWKYTSTNMAARHVANALVFRLVKLVKEQEQQDQQRVAETGSRALVPVDMIDAAMADAFGTLREMPASAIRTSSAAQNAAQNISLYRQTGGTGQRRIAG
jgi:hypothetical protein